MQSQVSLQLRTIFGLFDFIYRFGSLIACTKLQHEVHAEKLRDVCVCVFDIGMGPNLEPWSTR